MLKWAREHGCEWNSCVCSNAAHNGHFEILKWAREQGCEWNSNVCSYAALNGHIEILKWVSTRLGSQRLGSTRTRM